MALVEPPMASSAFSALSMLAWVTTSRMVRPDFAISMIAVPLASAAAGRSAWTAGMAAVPGSIRPITSRMIAMLDAVPMTAQVPALVASDPSIFSISRSPISPARCCAQKRRQSVQGTEALAAIARTSSSDRWARTIAGLPSRGGAHDQRRQRLVAAADEHDRIHRLGADHLPRRPSP